MRREVEDLFLAAAEVPAGERESFLQASGAGEDVLAEVRALLAHEQSTDSTLLGSISAEATSFALPEFGPYRATQLLGAGGMGVVYLAERSDHEITQKVAIKTAPAHYGRQGLGERFRLERQILAQLTHANIARLMDVGTAADGTPYLVMEYVDGEPIDQWCDRRQSGLHERIGIFLQCCEAVDHAHQNLVVHRDLKPANILVSENGNVKLLDFGIAKVLKETGVPVDSTIAMTPSYASPEQVRGEAITTATDVYGLGAVLYRLLAGAPPHKVEGLSIGEIMAVISAQEPERLSKLNPALAGDLENILLMALRKDPRRRYGTVRQLMDDIERWRASLPVTASPDSLAYRASRFWRRNRLPVSALAVAAAALIIGTVTATFQARRAERRFQDLRKLANVFVFDVYDHIYTLPGATAARMKIISTALEYLEKLRQDAGGDKGLLFELAATYQRIGNVQGFSSGETKAGIRSYEISRDILAELNRSGEPRALAPLADVHIRLALARVAAGSADPARHDCGRAEEFALAGVRRTPRDGNMLADAIEVFSTTARLFSTMRDLGRSLEAAKQAVAFAGRLAEIEPSSLKSREFQSQAYRSLGDAQMVNGNLTMALDGYRRALRLREQIAAEKPEDTNLKRLVMIGHGRLGEILGFREGENLGDLEGAAEQFRKAAEIAQWLRAVDPADRTAVSDVANARMRQGSVYVEMPGRAGEGLALLREAFVLFQKLAEEDKANMSHRYLLGWIEGRMGEGQAAAGRNREAVSRLESARKRLAGVFEAAPLARGRHLRYTLSLAEALALSQPERSLSLALEASSGLQKDKMGAPMNDATLLTRLGKLYLQLGQQDTGVRWLRQAVQAWRGLKLPPVLEPKRTAALSTLESLLPK
jgi:tetratricopeptide (TPR) repeat protein/predicted Ser/Thr protein kinase